MPAPPKPSYVDSLTAKTWAAMPCIERALHVAGAVIDQGLAVEVSRNNGPLIRRMLARVGIMSPAPWCAAFVTYCLTEAGVPRKELPRGAARVANWIRWAREKGLLIPRAGIERGVACAWLNKDKTGHIYFDLGPDSTGYHRRTAEGNTNARGEREGIKAMRRNRAPKEAEFVIDLVKFCGRFD